MMFQKHKTKKRNRDNLIKTATEVFSKSLIHLFAYIFMRPKGTGPTLVIVGVFVKGHRTTLTGFLAIGRSCLKFSPNYGHHGKEKIACSGIVGTTVLVDIISVHKATLVILAEEEDMVWREEENMS